MLTRDMLSAFVSYDSESGAFTRKKKVKGSTKKVGDLLGSDDGLDMYRYQYAEKYTGRIGWHFCT